MNPCLFQSPAGAASTFEPFRIPVLATLYTAPSRSFGVRLVHREWSYGLSWVSPLRLCLPSPCAPIIACLVTLVKGFEKIFLGSLSAIPRGSRLLQSDQRLAGLAVLGFERIARLAFVTVASPCSATIRGPWRGWGSLPLLTLLFYHTIGRIGIA